MENVIAKVYHKINTNFGLGKQAEVFVRGDYKFVADVTVPKNNNALNVAYELTNSIDDFWGNNPEVFRAEAKGCRSTSVEDVIEVNGKYFLVAGFGFEELKA